MRNVGQQRCIQALLQKGDVVILRQHGRLHMVGDPTSQPQTARVNGLQGEQGAHAAVLDPARPTEGCCTTFLAFGNGAAASMVYSGYDHFDSDEFHFWIGESGQPKTAAHASSRRSLRQSTADTAEAAVRAQRYGYGSPFWKAIQSAHRPHQPHFGVLIATCEKADARPSADGVLLYTHDGVQEVALPAGQSVPGYGDVLDEMVAAVQGQAAAVHDGRWGRDTLAVCLAILQSAREGREIFLPAA